MFLYWLQSSTSWSCLMMFTIDCIFLGSGPRFHSCLIVFCEGCHFLVETVSHMFHPVSRYAFLNSGISVKIFQASSNILNWFSHWELYDSSLFTIIILINFCQEEECRIKVSEWSLYILFAYKHFTYVSMCMINFTLMFLKCNSFIIYWSMSLIMMVMLI
jgi:hypothetical protein